MFFERTNQIVAKIELKCGGGSVRRWVTDPFNFYGFGRKSLL